MLSMSGSCSSLSGPDFRFFFSSLQGLDVGTRRAIGKVSFPHSRRPSDQLGSTNQSTFWTYCHGHGLLFRRGIVLFLVFLFSLFWPIARQLPSILQDGLTYRSSPIAP
jgi:hypothetical protein